MEYLCQTISYMRSIIGVVYRFVKEQKKTFFSSKSLLFATEFISDVKFFLCTSVSSKILKNLVNSFQSRFLNGIFFANSLTHTQKPNSHAQSANCRARKRSSAEHKKRTKFLCVLILDAYQKCETFFLHAVEW